MIRAIFAFFLLLSSVALAAEPTPVEFEDFRSGVFSPQTGAECGSARLHRLVNARWVTGLPHWLQKFMLGFLESLPILAWAAGPCKLSFRDSPSVLGLGARALWCMMQSSQQTEMTHAGRATSPGKQSHTATA